MTKRESPVGFAKLLAVGLVFCCGFPLLLGAGALTALAGFGLGSWLTVTAGLSVATLGYVRWRGHSAPACSVAPRSNEANESVLDDSVL